MTNPNAFSTPYIASFKEQYNLDSREFGAMLLTVFDPAIPSHEIDLHAVAQQLVDRRTDLQRINGDEATSI